MKKQDKELSCSRRQFLRHTACAGLGLTGLVNSISQLTLVNAALGQSSLSGYKALVVLFLYGGNDSNNMLIPRMGHPGYTDYINARRSLKIVDPGDPAKVAGDPVSIPLTCPDGNYAVHPNLQPVADLFHAGDLAFVANVGTLCYPLLTQQDLISGLIPVPEVLYSHVNQQQQWQSSVPDSRMVTTGWGGRAADLLHAGASGGPDSVSMCLSISGINQLQRGNQVVQYAIDTDGSIPLAGYGTKYSTALNPDGTYKTTTEGKRFKAFEDIMRYAHANLYEEGYNDVVRRARGAEATIGDAVASANASGVAFDTIFAGQSEVKAQLKMIAKMIAARGTLGNSRQIFFCSMGGFDTHDAQMGGHATLMEELGESLKAFRDALVALGIHDNVLTMTHSDFARTLSPNKPDPASAGTDHGWGGHQIVMGGGVTGGRIYGHFPSLVISAGRDVDSRNGRGRWIPTTSVDQYQAVAARWLGVDPGMLPAVFPNLGRFESPFSSAANLGYVL